MKTIFNLVFYFVISLLIVSCGESPNPTEVNSKNNTWRLLKSFDELNDPFVHFFNEDEGIIAGKVYYGKAILESPPIVITGRFKDTVEIIVNKLKDSSSVAKYPLWKTYDGGINWKPIKGFFRTSIIDMKFVDELVGFLITGGEGVFKTNDGGENWFRIMGSEIRFYSLDRLFPDFSVPREIDFYDADNGIITFIMGRNGFLYLTTSDGGLNWEFHNSQYIMRNVIFPIKNMGTGYATYYGSVVKTTDGGLTWNSIVDYNLSNKFAFLDHDNWVLYDNHKLFWTSDGGVSFNEVHDFENPNLYSPFLHDVIDISFSNNLCYLTNHDGIRVSEDSCRTFKLIPFEHLPYYDISFPNENVFYATNNIGEIYKFVNSD